DDIVDAFVSPLPRWIGVLMNVRNKIVSLAGLKTGNNTHGIVRPDKCVPGNKLGFFIVYDRTDNEVILGENDKHLDFRVSLFLDTHQSNPSKKSIAVTTVVVFNNWMGHVYFFFVKPFHKRIVPAMLRKDFSRF
ncbi:MAG TPA: DUF2867 domain-containing protein, partial [Bacteroidota bacterium]|nr:DUF2867 domain-containing protein [Bacteroidota bacterium]